MSRCLSGFTATLFLLGLFLAGCATPLPPTYENTLSGPALDGPVLALAGEGELVAAVTGKGLFLKKGDGPWVTQEVPGLGTFNKVTCLAVVKGAVYLGSDGDGLHILSNGVWEVKTSRYGGLPDDGVLSIAADDHKDDQQSRAVWVGTRKGFASYRDGEWKVYKPDADWLIDMTGRSGRGTGQVYLGGSYRLGRQGEDSDLFKPPVTAIGIGAGLLVLGNADSRIAIISGDGMAIVNLREAEAVTRLVVEEGTIWAGTERGLLWGGLRDVATGKPWPTHHPYLGWSGTLFGSRDSRPFEYRWKRMGYNNALVTSLQDSGEDIWAAYRSDEPTRLDQSKKGYDETDEESANPVSAVRRFVNVHEYIARRETGRYETYGPSAGVRGDPAAVYVAPGADRVWIGTSKGLWELEQY